MIRPFRAEDTDALIDLWYEASIRAHDFVPQDFWAREREAIRTEYLPISETHVYEQDGRVVGFLSLLGTHIGGLFVHPVAQGCGIGRALVLYAAAQYGTLTVNAFSRNAQALGFYQQMGFVEQGRGIEPTTGCEEVTLLREA